MCTIGDAFYDPGILLFKQCDLIDPTQFLEPVVTPGKGNIQYFPFLRVGSKGPWTGINNYGVAFVAADSYLDQDNKLKAVHDDIFEAYTKIISDNTTAADAAKYMCDFYSTFNQPDILLIGDCTSAYFIETYQGRVECVKRSDGFFASTNHFRILPGAVQYRNNHSTYLRLERAEALLQQLPNLNGILAAVIDQYFGETVLSICRVNQQTPPQEQPYYTQATAIFYTDGKVCQTIYQLNGNPRTNRFTFNSDIFGKGVQKTDLSIDEARKAMMSGK